jgi:hypothetical protein
VLPLIIVFVGLLLYTQVNAAEFFISSHTFLNNLEYVGEVDRYSTVITNNATGETIFLGEGQTFFGEHLALEFFHHRDNFLSYRFGVLGTRFYGDEDDFHKILPLITFEYVVPRGTYPARLGSFFPETKAEDHKFYLFFGSILNGPRRKLIEPLYDDALFYYRPVEHGLALGQKGHFWAYDIWINWQRLNTPFHRERFDIGIVSEVGAKAFQWKFQWHYVHEGGQLYHPGPVKDNFAWAFGPEFVWKKFRFLLIGCYAYDIPDRGNPDLFSDGWGLQSQIAFNGKKAKVFVESWLGKDFLTAEGDPFYQADWLVKFGFCRKWTLAKNTVLLLGARGYWVEGKFVHDERLEVRYSLDLREILRR